MQLAALNTENTIERVSIQISQRTAIRRLALGRCGFVALSQPCLSIFLKLMFQTVTLLRTLDDGLQKEELSII